MSKIFTKEEIDLAAKTFNINLKYNLMTINVFSSKLILRLTKSDKFLYEVTGKGVKIKGEFNSSFKESLNLLKNMISL